MPRFLRKYSNGNNPTNPGIPPSRSKATGNAGGVLVYYQRESQMQAAQRVQTDKAENRTGEQELYCSLGALLSTSGPRFPLLWKARENQAPSSPQIPCSCPIYNQLENLWS